MKETMLNVEVSGPLAGLLTPDRLPGFLRVVAYVGAGMFALAGIFLGGEAADSYFQSKKTSAWPTVQATVTSLEVRPTEEVDGESGLQPVVEYRYAINKKPMTGSFVPGKTIYSGEGASELARNALEAYKIHGPVTLHYNPKNPREALTADSLGPPPLIFLGAAVVFLFGSFLWFKGWKHFSDIFRLRPELASKN